ARGEAKIGGEGRVRPSIIDIVSILTGPARRTFAPILVAYRSYRARSSGFEPKLLLFFNHIIWEAPDDIF
ncbi:MAG: hypothetical protein PHV30_12080, partial [Candidatus Margulisbacteria bacterium]|nr:hypothetical protein [Candidatus Margulisiibacteriota bacterium]